MIKRIKKGFTLVELLVVIAIIAILAAIIAPNAFKAIEKSKVATAESDYKAIKTAALSYYGDTGKWPANSADLVKEPNSINGWNGPYLEKWPTKNPWGGTYTFGTISEQGKEVKLLRLTKVNSNACEKLEADLDGDSNYKAGTVRYSGETVDLIISDQN